MRSTGLIDKLIELFEEKTDVIGAIHRADKALLYLLKEYQEVLPEVDDFFHKSFRSSDVTDSENIDMAIWHLIGLSDLFWEAFHEITENKYV